jgi:hypothetical protein
MKTGPPLSFIFSVSTPSLGATWLNPLIAASTNPGAGLEGEALADQSVDLVLMVEHVGAGDDAAGAVAEQIDQQARIAPARQFDQDTTYPGAHRGAKSANTTPHANNGRAFLWRERPEDQRK